MFNPWFWARKVHKSDSIQIETWVADRHFLQAIVGVVEAYEHIAVENGAEVHEASFQGREEAPSVPEAQEVVPQERLPDSKESKNLWFDNFQWQVD